MLLCGSHHMPAQSWGAGGGGLPRLIMGKKTQMFSRNKRSRQFVSCFPANNAICCAYIHIYTYIHIYLIFQLRKKNILKDWRRLLCGHSYVAGTLPYKQKHDKIWCGSQLRSLTSLSPHLNSHWLLERHRRIPDV